MARITHEVIGYYVFLLVGPAPVYADLDKTGPRQPDTKPPVASWGGNRFVSNDFLQVQ
jgi:hypothetical protein